MISSHPCFAAAAVMVACGPVPRHVASVPSPSFLDDDLQGFVVLRSPSSLELGHFEACAKKGMPAAQYALPLLSYFADHVLVEPVVSVVSTYVAEDDEKAIGAAIEKRGRTTATDRRAVFTFDLRTEQGVMFVGQGTRFEYYCVRPHIDTAHNAVVIEADHYMSLAR
jgi:hypothetical protein